MKCTYLWAHTHTTTYYWSNSPQLFQHLYLDATASLIWLVLSLIPTFQQMAQINWLLFVFYLNAASAAKQLIFEFVLNIRELFLAVIFHTYLSCGSVNLLHINNSSLTPRNYILCAFELLFSNCSILFKAQLEAWRCCGLGHFAESCEMNANRCWESGRHVKI